MREIKAYNEGYREGMAIGIAEVLERAAKHSFPEEYKLYKSKLAMLSEYESEILFYKLIKEKNSETIQEFIEPRQRI